ncbi:nickel pincer cofactor biosynthesis protein LarB [Clostridium tyrobutyricum]|mgnify:CR=1 FL=1|uniref:Circadian phase modifier @ NCAIR mutase (PurE)-related protein n=1 Tax=Clostridium tyrobutyricum DIVETGP TaxID=1408889 RepID=W6N4D6_CLOTY|nr:nickel pincer cofactor biosynthesis protein LarB [Clostridium tyrobutyricum]AND83375.1 1-(5-phosphoribosyl)-5-amino-4-imidazole-carboxylate (AIR) carboxylase [Clostridium tyrobutyricum]ANP68178.1 1-(5-phosphoribosyl)-5-amino-4-imidazole-carboxylate carboxylase [Clostridium tyrobutyricum]MBR9649423.1 nickel pincer cofactor biosynthesis protein LarB [Clostridium tyrobutyricum]MBV4416316.1 nickel pincer cofactor biosynthesis protein LarB [Clostridium tyrobutyricum]MBV4421472.1 nickel pincer co
MNSENIKKLFEKVKQGSMSVEDAVERLKDLPFKDLGYAKIDNSREMRVGYPEVIYCAGKTVAQVKGIVEAMMDNKDNILGTRATKEQYEAVKKICPKAKYNEQARIITIKNKKIEMSKTYIAVVTAGTSDIPVSEEAALTAEIFGEKVERIYDVGVAGIHRLFSKLELIRGAKVVIVIAGMEGALASVVGGLVNKPVIAVPTSIGYGANFNGLSALLSMLNSCASGVSVVNIDNGFGAAYLASIINRLH